MQHTWICGTHLVANQERPGILIKLEINGAGEGRGWEVMLYFQTGLVFNPGYGSSHTKIYTELRGGDTEWEWAAGNYRSKWAVWVARETRRYKWHPALTLLSGKGIPLWMLKVISCILKQEGLRRGRDNIAVLLTTETSTDFPSKSDSPVTAVWSSAD